MRLEKHFFSILESLHDAVIVILMDSTIVYVNSAYSKHFDVPAKKIIGRKLRDIEENSRILDVLKSGKPLINDYSYVHSLGKDVCANITPLMENGHMTGVVTVMKNISEVTHLQEELMKYKHNISELQEELDRRNFSKLKSESLEMQKAVQLARKVASTNATVVLHGESGVGKEIFAKAIHEASARSDKPFVAINMASIPDTLFESEMFGYEEGSFTGSRKGGKKGLLEMAKGGTLLLDEIGEMSINTQSKLLRVIQERTFQKVGGTVLHPLDVRIICATHRKLSEMVLKGEFREDLYYRLNVVPIHIPPLRKRKKDLSYLSTNILNDLCSKYGKYVWLEDEVVEWMEKYEWPGNVRELSNFLERMIAISTKPCISMEDIPDNLLGERLDHSAPIQNTFKPKQISPEFMPPLSELLEELERSHIDFVVKNTKNKTEAIQVLGISRKSFYEKLKKYETT